MRYIHLWVEFFKNCFKRELEFRGNFVIQIFGNFLQFTISIIFFKVLYLHVSTIGGWDIYRTLLLLGTTQLVNELYNVFFGENIPKISRYISKGDLDFLLLKPVDTQFLISTRYINYSAIFSLIYPACVIIFSIYTGNIAVSVFQCIIYIFLLLFGFLMRYAFGFGVMVLSFWVTRIGALHSLSSEFFQQSKYPISIFKGGMRIFFTFIIPIILIGNYPVLSITKDLRLHYPITAFILAILFFYLTRAFFKWGIKFYSSASS